MRLLFRKKELLPIFLLLSLMVLLPLIFRGVGQKQYPKKMAQPSTPTPTVPPSGNILYFKASFQGFSSENARKFGVTLKAKDTDFSQTLVLAENGESEAVDLEELEMGETYEFLLSSWGFLTAKKSLTVKEGRNPQSGFLDFGILKTGDLNGDNQINGLDWSLMKLHYGESGV